MLRALAVSALALVAVHLGGCATQDASALAGARIPADSYARTFQAAREVLRDYRYTADRVDAQQGVLTSLARSEPGLAKPWEARSGAAAAWEDLANYQQRTIHVAFVQGEASGRAPGTTILPATDPDRDLASEPRDTTMLVRVLVDRFERDGRRVSQDSVRVVRQAIDPVLREKGQWPGYLVAGRDDALLAADLLRIILERSRANATTAQAPPASPATP